jgi:hypothetical protein
MNTCCFLRRTIPLLFSNRNFYFVSHLVWVKLFTLSLLLKTSWVKSFQIWFHILRIESNGEVEMLLLCNNFFILSPRWFGLVEQSVDVNLSW